jgi:hypothetical protein
MVAGPGSRACRHPRFPQEALRAYHAEHGMLTESWSPIGRGQGLLEDQTIIRLAAQKQKSPAQVVLRWHMQLGNIAIPKSVTPARIGQNIDIFDFTLDEDEMGQLNRLATGERIGPDPDTFNAVFNVGARGLAHTVRSSAHRSGSSRSSSLAPGPGGRCGCPYPDQRRGQVMAGGDDQVPVVRHSGDADPPAPRPRTFTTGWAPHGAQVATSRGGPLA